MIQDVVQGIMSTYSANPECGHDVLQRLLVLFDEHAQLLVVVHKSKVVSGHL